MVGPDEGHDPTEHRQRHQGFHRAGGDVARRVGRVASRHVCARAARNGLAVDRRRRDHRAPARSPVRDRRLPRRGDAGRHLRPRDAGASAPARLDGGLPQRSRRFPAGIFGGREVFLQKTRPTAGWGYLGGARPGPGPTVFLEGYDAVVSFRSMHDPTTGLTRTTISNTSEGTWDLLRAVSELHET